MIMMLPFLTAMLTVWFGIRGQRRMCLSLWFINLLIFAAWCRFHMTDPLGFSLYAMASNYFYNDSFRCLRRLNTLALAGVCGILLLAFVWQFAFNQLPCTLCLLQRLALDRSDTHP